MTAASPTSRSARPRTGRTVALLLAAAVAAGALAAPAATSAAPAPAVPGDRYGTPLSPRLQVLADEPAGTPEQRSNRVGLAPDGPGSLSQDDGGRLFVDVQATSTRALADAVAASSASVEATSPEGRTATLAIAPARLESLASTTGIRSVHEIAEPTIGGFQRADALAAPLPLTTAAAVGAFEGCPTGIKHSFGDSIMNGPDTRTETGARGTGVKVGIISDSYGASRAKGDIARADLPGAGNPCGHTTPVQVVADDYTDGTDEGRAMAQIVHDVAPGATLMFADAGRSPIEMASHIRALRDAGAKVIVDDVRWGDEAFYQDAIIAAAVDEVAADGVAYYSSAGNAELKVAGKSVGSYEAQAFRPTACPAVLAEFDSTCHDFNPASGTSATNTIGIPKWDTLNVALGWNEPMYGVETDLDIYVLDDATGKVITSSASDSVGYGQAIEWVSVPNPSSTTRKVRLVVARYGADATTAPRFKLELNAYSLASVQWNTSSGGDVMGPTLRGHANAAGGHAIGASQAKSSNRTLEPYSSSGPASTCWEPAHGLTPAAPIDPCTESLVDYVAPDGVETSMTDFDPFYGTSAAAPHAAGLAALMFDQAPCLSLTTLDTLLADRAVIIPSASWAAQGAGHLMTTAVNDSPTCNLSSVAPAAPQILSVTGTTVRLRMTDPPGAEFPSIGYRIQTISSTGTEIATEEIAASGSGGAVDRDITIQVGTAYRFRVQAKNPGWTPWSPSSALAVPPFSSATAYLNQLAADFTSRTLTDDERQVLTFVLTDGYGPAHAAVEASQFDPWATKLNPVIRLFYAYFGRKPDPSGLNYWLNRRRSGITLDKISSTFAASNEFKTKYGALSNNAFVKLVYQNVLGRSGDAGGISYWTKQLDAKKKNRGQVMTGFSESNEHLRRRFGEYTTIDLFFGMLRRVPTADEMTEWVPQIAADVESEDGAGMEALAQHLFASAEYLDRVS